MVWKYNNGTLVLDNDDTSICNKNPFRYKSYYLDIESGLYYLNSRYYNPKIGKFITIDSINYIDESSIYGYNLYCYCGNNPVMYLDRDGRSPNFWQWTTSVVELVAGIALCFVPGAQGIGVSSIIAGATSMTSNILDVCGIDGRTSAIIMNCVNIVGGAALLLTPFAGIGANMIGTGIGGMAGGYISEGLGRSFEVGSLVGNFVGSIIGGRIYKAYDNMKINNIKEMKNVVIGEKMDRVKEAAAKYNAGHFSASKFANKLYNFNHKLGAALTYSENVTWIRRVCQAGVNIINIGPVGRNSIYYAMEIRTIIAFLGLR